MEKKPCFFMWCKNTEEKEEWLKENLFKGWRWDDLKFIKKGDIGFLLNIETDELFGIFEAIDSPQFNNQARGKEYPVEVKVKLSNDKIQSITKASEKLEKIIYLKLKKITRETGSFKIPLHHTYGPEITEKILALFKTPDIQKILPEEIISLEEELEKIAGLENVKKFIRQRIIKPFEDEERAKRLKLKVGGGILLVGPPGTGKTLVAQTIAKGFQAKFTDISPSVIKGYPGEAEENLEKIFEDLENEPRAVVFLDEAEWILCKREKQTSSVMQRITPTFLRRLSKIFKENKEKLKPIIVIAATNQPEMIDSAFLRPGRFDRILYVGLPDEKAREKIIKLNLEGRAHNLEEDDIKEIAKKLDGYSGADIEYIIDESAYIAFDKEKDFISKEDIEEAINETPKSVKLEEAERIKKWAQKRGVKCD